MLENSISLFASEEPRKRPRVIIVRGVNRLEKVTMEMKYEMKRLYCMSHEKRKNIRTMSSCTYLFHIFFVLFKQKYLNNSKQLV